MLRPGADFRGLPAWPRILVRFYTVPDVKTARNSVVWAMVLIGSFYIMTTFLGFRSGRPSWARISIGTRTHGGTNMSAPLLANAWPEHLFRVYFVDRIRYDSRGGSRSDDQRDHLVRSRLLDKRNPQGTERRPGEEVLVARISAFVVGAVAISIAIVLGPTANVAFPVRGVCGSGVRELPVIVLSIFWRGLTPLGAVAGLRWASGVDWVDPGEPELDGESIRRQSRGRRAT